VAAGIALRSEASLPLMVAIVVGGAFFGDNLSFISDTTIVATRTQGCRMSDKFRTNLRLVLPVALLMLVVYYFIGRGVHTPTDIPDVDYWKILPYLTVILTAVCGLNVLYVLVLGLALTGVIGILDGSYDLFAWFSAMSSGMMGMSELIVMTLLAAGMLAMIRHNGGIDFLIRLLTRGVRTRRSAEMSIASLVCLVDVCTANNTVAILTAGPIAADIARRFQLDPRRTAGLLDTVSCFTQGLLPYGAQMLIAAGLASEAAGAPLSPAAIIGYLYYPMGLALAVLISIWRSR
jgi:Na+/H+ antiporter NhaC